MNTTRTAVLVDGDNVSPVHSARILTQAAKSGRVDIARTYVNGAQTSGWHSEAGFQAIHSGLGKNSSDMLLSIDAMQFALTSRITQFLIVSSDGDFSHLAFRLRELGAEVQGLGEAKAPAGFRKACNHFQEIESPKVQQDAPCVSNLVAPLDLQVKNVIRDNGDAAKGIRVALLGGLMHTKHGTLSSDLAGSNWHSYLAKRPALYAVGPRGRDTMVKFRPIGFRQQ